ncbi:hypothetical protein TanjilG_18121 [Lupinus angustifolius]|uniref:Uncharacterized protein n=2 Tax=Lupinus angustifolius TaxID=3871 RepID=A0A1J7IPU6_LUPAN|nr:hypothetical protein TanjilG_18121 [Lupinus angustifolius]
MDLALKEWSERWLHIVEGGGDIADEVEYMQWYQKITRKYIGRVTSSLESEYQRTVTTMREIAKIADVVSAEGLGSYNRGLLDEVKNVVHRCLTEQLEEIPKDKMKRKGNRKRRQKDDLSMEYEPEQ